MSALSMHNVSHAFGCQSVLSGVSLHVPSGTVACLLGPSGCGKTTLLRLAAGLEPLQAGQVAIADSIVAGNGQPEVPPERRNVGLMFQDYALFPHLTVAGNITFGITRSRAERHAWVNDALERMGLSGFADRYPHELSGGQQQRVALLRALAPAPRILLLDEPFSGLDISRRSQVRESTLELLKETGHTALMVTHDPEEAMFMADLLLVMDQGHLVQSGVPVDIYKAPASTFVADLFGHTNKLDCVCTGAGVLDTPFGSLHAPGLNAGDCARVIMRAEGIGFSAMPESSLRARATVSAVYPTGQSTQLRLSLENRQGPNIRLHARVSGIHRPEPGSVIEIAVDPEHVFVFPADS